LTFKGQDFRLTTRLIMVNTASETRFYHALTPAYRFRLIWKLTCAMTSLCFWPCCGKPLLTGTINV